jgi:hypothetical protein
LAPYNVYFGSGIRSNLSDIYRAASERGAIITSLDAAAVASPQQSRAVIAKDNKKLITAFRRDLAQSNLSMKMILLHTENIETFARAYLLEQVPPRRLIELTSVDVASWLAQTKLSAAAHKTLVTSFKRLVRFLYDSYRIEDTAAQQIRQILK